MLTSRERRLAKYGFIAQKETINYSCCTCLGIQHNAYNRNHLLVRTYMWVLRNIFSRIPIWSSSICSHILCITRNCLFVEILGALYILVIDWPLKANAVLLAVAVSAYTANLNLTPTWQFLDKVLPNWIRTWCNSDKGRFTLQVKVRCPEKVADALKEKRLELRD